MFTQIISLVLDVAASLVGGACLMRLVMQWQRIPFNNPLGQLGQDDCGQMSAWYIFNALGEHTSAWLLTGDVVGLF